MALPTHLRKVAANTKRIATAAAKKKAATAPVTAGPGLLKLLSAGKIGAAFKGHPMTMGFGALMLLQLIMNRIGQHGKSGLQQGLEGQAIEQQMGQSEDDMYYQAMAGNLGQERQATQNALLQAIMSGRGMPQLAKGERTIGGGGGGYKGGF